MARKSRKIIEMLLERGPLDVVLAAGFPPTTWAPGFIQAPGPRGRRVAARQRSSSGAPARPDRGPRDAPQQRKAA
jgi:hypothetical protein